ncbi:hypothetical protein EDC94DRAFT_654999 [Helicostylum pulchrum]|nr:hypothetical protein EDC94DRAFT_654999 [Helicostylum pulchrum]
MIFTLFLISVLWIFWICLYASCPFIIRANCRRNGPLPVPEILGETGLPDMIEYDHVQITDRFFFHREGDARIFETYLDRLQMWVRRNRFRPLVCLLGNRASLLFQQQTVKRLSQNILVELFSVDRETRLKELLRYMCYHLDEQNAVIVARSITLIISTYFGIKIVADGPNEFEEAPMSILRALCSSRNLFVCGFMLRHLTTSDYADEIIARYDLNELLSIDTSTEDTHVAYTGEERDLRWMFLGFNRQNREDFGHFFYRLTPTVLVTEVQMACTEMTDQYINYQRSFEEFEVAYTILKTIDIVDCFRWDVSLSIARLNQRLQRRENGLQPATYASVNKSLCAGSNIMTDLILTWDTYVEFSSSFENVRRTYQISINAMEQDFITTVTDFRREYDTFRIIRRFIPVM